MLQLHESKAKGPSTVVSALLLVPTQLWRKGLLIEAYDDPFP